MRPWRASGAALLGLALAGCTAPAPPTTVPAADHVTKGFPATDVRDSAYLLVDRSSAPPSGYGLYSVLLARSPDRNSVRVLAELFATTGAAADAALARENLNLIAIPVKNAARAAPALASARNEPDAAATALLQKSYDFGEAALLMASVCHPSRGPAVMKACRSQSPDGPLLVTTLRPLDGRVEPGEPLLIVNLSTTPPEAVREVVAAYRRQILRKDPGDGHEFGWRLAALDHILDAAQLLPGLSKAYASGSAGGH